MNIGIIGTGWIAEKMAFTVNEMSKGEDVRIIAVGSRAEETARKFAERFAVPKAYASYEELCGDGEVDLIYVATPHNLHCENMITALNAGRNVLCEKPFTVNAKQARRVIELAEKKNLFAGEAIWTRYFPLREKFSHIHDGSIGKPLSLEANLSYPNSHIQRMYDPDLAGGALLDLGVYTVNFAIMAFGDDIVKIESKCGFFDTGVDRDNEVILTYSDGKTARLTSSVAQAGDLRGTVKGERGQLVFQNINNYEWVELVNSEGTARYNRPEQITGYEYQVRSCADAIRRGLKEPDEMKHCEILRVMDIMDEIRRQLGIKYPFD